METPPLKSRKAIMPARSEATPGPGSAAVPARPIIPDHELLRCIGRGGYGEVWLARSLTGGWRAVKVVRQHSGEQAKAFEREFRGIQYYEPISRSDESLMVILHVGRQEAEGFFSIT